MTSIRPSDDDLHHSDGSHRWSGGPLDEAGQALFQAALRQHVEEHRSPARSFPANRRPRFGRPKVPELDVAEQVRQAS